ncbi:MAG: hypothetical protein DIJKHBIC_02010 [Thermoanaerobaculia bacterium]|nr:hypothetical protein [Thermoanaerobaculia bacterium]
MESRGRKNRWGAAGVNSFVKALFRPIPLVVVAASGLTVFATGLWWLLPMGLAAGGIIAALSAGGHESAAPLPPPDELAGCTPEQRARLKPLLEEKARILSELVKRELETALDQEDVAGKVEAVVRTYKELLTRLEELKPVLEEKSSPALRRSIEDLERQIERSTDPIARESLTLALQHKKDEEARISELSRHRERVEAQLLSLASALTNLRVRLVQGRVSRDGSQEPATGIKESLEGLFHEVEVADRTSRELDQLVQDDRRAPIRRPARLSTSR